MRPRLLDLFCGAGGAALGYYRAGFDVFGVDHEPQPRYPFAFVQVDALRFDPRGFDVVHASPPCQAWSAITPDRSLHAQMVEPVRQRLLDLGVPYVIENVVGAPLIDPVRVCGSSLDLADAGGVLRRHRLFESNVPLIGTPCEHDGRATYGVYGDLRLNDRPGQKREYPTIRAGRQRARELMGIEGTTVPELVEAVPPAYTEHIGRQLMAAL
jgi:hypothetical protein